MYTVHTPLMSDHNEHCILVTETTSVNVIVDEIISQPKNKFVSKLSGS